MRWNATSKRKVALIVGQKNPTWQRIKRGLCWLVKVVPQFAGHNKIHVVIHPNTQGSNLQAEARRIARGFKSSHNAAIVQLLHKLEAKVKQKRGATRGSKLMRS
jgi:hypothetical protein